jgi:hypothetical protein
MKKQCEGYITLFDEHSNCMQSRPYTSFEDRIGILNEWKKHFHHSNGYLEYSMSGRNIFTIVTAIWNTQ